MSRERIAILGAGSWGTALAAHLAGWHDVRVWCRRESLAREIRDTRVNEVYLAGVTLPDAVEVTSILGAAIEDASLIVVTVPTQHVRGVFGELALLETDLGGLVLGCKGIEVGTTALPRRIVCDVLGLEAAERSVTLSGPSFARELARAEPTAIVAAGTHVEQRARVQAGFSHATLRVYTSSDVIGVEIAGAMKNVVALAAGVCDGLGLGSNALAALITRGLAEIRRLGVALGAEPATFMGLAGLGDLVLTCTGPLSRNRQAGQMLGRGLTLAEVRGASTMVAEGIETTRAARALAEVAEVEMPLVEQVHALLFEGRTPRSVVDQLLARPLRAEDEERSI